MDEGLAYARRTFAGVEHRLEVKDAKRIREGGVGRESITACGTVREECISNLEKNSYQ